MQGATEMKWKKVNDDNHTVETKRGLSTSGHEQRENEVVLMIDCDRR